MIRNLEGVTAKLIGCARQPPLLETLFVVGDPFLRTSQIKRSNFIGILKLSNSSWQSISCFPVNKDQIHKFNYKSEFRKTVLEFLYAKIHSGHVVIYLLKIFFYLHPFLEKHSLTFSFFHFTLLWTSGNKAYSVASPRHLSIHKSIIYSSS